jgi:hypothetical protein
LQNRPRPRLPMPPILLSELLGLKAKGRSFVAPMGLIKRDKTLNRDGVLHRFDDTQINTVLFLSFQFIGRLQHEIFLIAQLSAPAHGTFLCYRQRVATFGSDD